MGVGDRAVASGILVGEGVAHIASGTVVAVDSGSGATVAVGPDIELGAAVVAVGVG